MNVYCKIKNLNSVHITVKFTKLLSNAKYIGTYRKIII